VSRVLDPMAEAEGGQMRHQRICKAHDRTTLLSTITYLHDEAGSGKALLTWPHQQHVPNSSGTYRNAQRHLFLVEIM
jgi:hypothetical protein